MKRKQEEEKEKRREVTDVGARGSAAAATRLEALLEASDGKLRTNTGTQTLKCEHLGQHEDTPRGAVQ